MTGGEPTAELVTHRVDSSKPLPNQISQPKEDNTVKAGLYKAEATRQAKIDKSKIDKVRGAIAQESGSDLPVPHQEQEATKTKLEGYLDTLEGPRDGDQELVAKYEAEIRERRKTGEFDDKDPVLDPIVEEARERILNPQLKESLPKAVMAAKELIRIKPDIDPPTKTPRKLPAEFYAQRAEDLVKILDMDFTPPADGSLGANGEVAVLRLIQLLSEQKLLSSALDRQVGKFEGVGSEGTQLFAEQIHEIVDKVGGIASTKFRGTASAPNLDVFAEQVNPNYYQDFRRNQFLTPPQRTS